MKNAKCRMKLDTPDAAPATGRNEIALSLCPVSPSLLGCILTLPPNQHSLPERDCVPRSGISRSSYALQEAMKKFDMARHADVLRLVCDPAARRRLADSLLKLQATT